MKVGLTPELNVTNLIIGLDVYQSAEDTILAAYNVPTNSEPEKVTRTIHAYTHEDWQKQFAIMTDENPVKTPFEFFFLPAEKAVLYGLYTEGDTQKLNIRIEGEDAITSGTELFEPSNVANKVELSNVLTALPAGHELSDTIFDKEIIEKLAGFYSPTVGDVLFVTESNRGIGDEPVNSNGNRRVYEDVKMVGIITSVGVFSRADISVLEEPYLG